MSLERDYSDILLGGLGDRKPSTEGKPPTVGSAGFARRSRPRLDYSAILFAWTTDRIAAVVLGFALCVFLYIFFFGKRRGVTARSSEAGVREIVITVAGGYEPDLVVAKKGIPLRLIFDRRESSPCTDEVLLPEFGIRRELPAHARTEIEVLPQRAGDFPFSCGMNMLHGKIRVEP